MAAKKGCTASQLAIAWTMAQGNFIFPIPGTKHIKYLDENAGAFSIKLTGEELKAIEAIFPSHAAAGLRYPENMMGSIDK